MVVSVDREKERELDNKGCTREFLYNQITASTTICIEIPAYTLYFVREAVKKTAHFETLV